MLSLGHSTLILVMWVLWKYLSWITTEFPCLVHRCGGNHQGISSSPTLSDLDGDGLIEIAAATYSSYVYVWDTPGQALPAAITMANGA